MKKIIYLSLICAAIATACNKKAAPSGSTGSVGSSSTSKTTTTAATKTDAQTQAELEAKRQEEAKQGAARPTAPQKPSEDVAGESIYTTKCTRCHAAKPVGNWTFNQWEGILKSMVPKARLSADEESQVTAYIKAHAK